MKSFRHTMAKASAALLCALALPCASVWGDIDISQTPVFVNDSVPPLNMLVMGRDHKLYYEAYNDASDLNGDGILDVGYKGYLSKNQGGIDYYGYFNSFVCYDYDTGTNHFNPASATTDKKCSGRWSGDFLNYLTTSRMDALRKVLYGGYRVEDTVNSTVLQAAYIPQDAHTWGKEYQSLAKDGYLISDYTPLAQPTTGGFRHLFAVVSLTQDTGVPQLRTLTNTTFRIWNWVSKERPVAGNDCVNSSGSEVSCTSGGPSGGNWSIVPADQLSDLKLTTWKDSQPTSKNKSEMDTLFGSTYSKSSTRCGRGNPAPFTNISSPNNFINPYNDNNCSQDGYHTLIEGKLTPTLTGTYQFSVDGDDAVEFQLAGTVRAARYGDHGKAGHGGEGFTDSVYLEAGKTYDFMFRHEENGGDANFYLYWKTPASGTSTLTDKNIKVSVCPSGADNAALRDSNCVAYGSNFKPTGILHDYGATNKMYFGLLTGSYQKNLSGGVLRSKLQSFSKEYNANTGQFCFAGTNVCGTDSVSNGIVATINKLRIIDFNYSNQSYGCGWITTRPITQSDTCYMWGNPIGEMMYETMRYFSGATSPTSTYDYGSGSSKDNDLGLPRIGTWTPPYKSESNANGYPVCSVPAMTVISDINPSYDFKLPGSKFSTDVSAPSSGPLSTLNVSTEADNIWAAEGGGTKSIFIGESNGVADSAPTAKNVSNLSTVRGLAPEEPSKQGTYYSAAIARFGAQNRIGGDKHLLTYSVALASPLPTIKFPVTVGGVTSTVTVVPFAKSVGGSDINANGTFQPTDQIVDYYVETFANTSPACNGGTPSLISDCDSTVNSGRPYAKFRINYEDVEQGADHDMDAIALYELMVNDQGKLIINITSEYAAGGIDQHMGYVISGTTKDGVYLEVKDQGGNNVAYKLDTPEGRDPSYCNVSSKPNDCTLSRLSSSRTFTVSGNPSATFLENPLWYAAKYGTTATNNDVDDDGVPDNYFLVTNALTLKDQLNKAFNDIYQRNSSVSTPSVERLQSGASINDARSVYRSNFLVDDWSGDLIKETIDPSTFIRTVVWHAKDNIPVSRNIKFRGANGGLSDFTYDNLANLSYNSVSLQSTISAAQLAYVRGSRSGEGSDFRRRNTLLGDIINSNPVVVSGAQYLAYLAGAIDGGYQKYADFIAAKKTRRSQVYVGANDGMLHAFDGATGVEKFAFVPRAVIPNLRFLSSKDYTAANHRWFVDGSVTVRDVYFDDNWHTVLIGTLGAGGRAAFALDVTDPDNISLLWEIDDDNPGTKDRTNTTLSNLGLTIPTPVIARLHSGQWGVLLPNGYNSANNSSGKAVMFVLDIKTGAILKTLEAQGVADTNGLPTNGLSSIRGADNNSDGIIDYAYAGDLQGNLWRFDLIDTAATNPFASTTVAASTFKTSFGGNPLYVAKDVAKDADGSNGLSQPITAPPSLVRHPSTTGYLVIFGTGRYLGTSDKSGPFQLQTLYGIWDKKTKGEATTSTPTLARSNLQVQTISEQVLNASFSSTNFDIRLLSQNTVDWTQQSGWYLDLKVDNGNLLGERIVDEMAARGQTLLLSTRTPNSDVCQAGVDGWSYGIDPYTGGRANFNVFDLNQNFVVDQGDAYSAADGSKMVSGYKTPAGGSTLSGNTRFNADGSPMNISFGPESTGRQTWRVVPQ